MMGISVREKTGEEIEAKLNTMDTGLNKIAYLESALKTDLTYDVKRLIWEKLVELYEARGMFDKAGRAMKGKVGVEVSLKDKIESYLTAGELYAKSGKLEDAEEMFLRAYRGAKGEEKLKIKLAMKNIFLVNARELEKKGKKIGAVKYYEKLIKMSLNELEKAEIKEKLVEGYRALGRFKDATLLEGF